MPITSINRDDPTGNKIFKTSSHATTHISCVSLGRAAVALSFDDDVLIK